MAARNWKRGFKRFLEDSAADRVDQGKSGCSYVRSKRFKTSEYSFYGSSNSDIVFINVLMVSYFAYRYRIRVRTILPLLMKLLLLGRCFSKKKKKKKKFGISLTIQIFQSLLELQWEARILKSLPKAQQVMVSDNSPPCNCRD